MFGRILSITASKDNGDSIRLVDHNKGVDNLIVKGTIQRFPSTEICKVILSIYNLSPVLRGEISIEGGYNTINIFFGYEDEGGTLTNIFSGKVQRVIYRRLSDLVTTETVLYAFEAGDFKNYGFYSGSYDDGVNYYQIAQDIARNGTQPISIELSEKLKKYSVKNSKVIYDTQDNALQNIANELNLMYKVENGVASIIDANYSNSEGDIIIFNKITNDGKIVSSSGLIGLPQLTDDGLYFDCLINPKMKIFGLALFSNSAINMNQEGFEPQRSLGAQLDDQGLYRIVTMTTEFTNDDGECKTSVKALSKNIYDKENL